MRSVSVRGPTTKQLPYRLMVSKGHEYRGCRFSLSSLLSPLYCTNYLYRRRRRAYQSTLRAKGGFQRTEPLQPGAGIRSKYGYESVRRGLQLVHPELDLDAKGDHIIHPVGISRNNSVKPLSWTLSPRQRLSFSLVRTPSGSLAGN